MYVRYFKGISDTWESVRVAFFFFFFRILLCAPESFCRRTARTITRITRVFLIIFRSLEGGEEKIAFTVFEHFWSVVFLSYACTLYNVYNTPPPNCGNEKKSRKRFSRVRATLSRIRETHCKTTRARYYYKKSYE